ncbi:MAG: GNAT family N-acetyltransferase [Proteobacteria bacterium]|nr:GNAT family N-acetyltransferase [Pseudomonadota bacterium]
MLVAFAAAGVPMPMQQHPIYGAVLRRLGREVRYGLWRAAGAPAGLAQVARRPGLALLSRGPLWLDPEPPAPSLRDIAGSALTIATPEHPVAGRGLIPIVAPRSQAIWHLPGDAALLRAGLRANWRNKLLRAERMAGAITVRVSAKADAGWLYAAEAAQRLARRYHALPPGFAEVWRAVAPGSFLLYEARRDGQPVAGMLILKHWPWASYHLSWSGAQGRQLNAQRLLLWRAARDLQDDGFAAFDLGDVNSGAAPGLADFKAGTGAEIRALGPTLLVLPRLTRRRW